MTTEWISKMLLCLVLGCCYIASYHTLLGCRAANHALHEQTPSGWDLPPLVLQILAGEFKGLVADLILLETGARLGTELMRTPQGGYRIVKKQYDWPAIHRLFVSSQSLDPAFAQTYILAQGWLPWEPANMVQETQEILQRAALNRPWDWRPIHDMGFNEYYFRNNQGKAGALFLDAAKIVNAPPFLAMLGARLAQRGGETLSAITILKSMIGSKNVDEPGYVDLQERLQALEGVLALERAVHSFEKVKGRRPDSLGELLDSGIIATLPQNPYKQEYCIDVEGKIYFDQPDCRK